MKLSIIIVSYNTADLTVQTIQSCLEDIKRSKLLDQQTEIIVIDNNSKDNSVKAIHQLAEAVPKIKLIKNKNNPGFAVANNQGIKKAKGEYILLLNSDTIVQKGALEKLVKAFENFKNDESTATLSSYHGKLDKLGILSATLLNQDGTIQPQGGSLPTLFSLFNHYLLLNKIPIIGQLLPSTQRNILHPASWILHPQGWTAATAMLVKREVFDEIGLLDENIFMYGEDVEFCMRAQDHHWDIAIHPKAFITHIGSASSNKKNAIIGEIKGYLYIWSKHKPLWQIPILKLILKLGCFLRITIFGKINKEKAGVYKEALTITN